MKIAVIVNGIRGKMGQEIVKACECLGVEIVPWGLTSSDSSIFEIGGKKIELKKASNDTKEELIKELIDINSKLKDVGKRLIVIDFTLPESALFNWSIYSAAKIPFVMGTTGFDLIKMAKDTEALGVYAVIAPNMCKQIVALQSMISSASENFPGSFNGYKLTITESHQKTKVDTSGTAKAMLNYFNMLCGSNVKLEDVKKLRNERDSVEFGVPEENLMGHAFHTYDLRSGDGSVNFQFKHNVCGRSTYAEGVLDAVLFLNDQVNSKSSKTVFDMIDVLKAGNMR